MSTVESSRKISFHFHPMNPEGNEHAVEKSDNTGTKRRYLRGLSSGVKVDGHGERITDKCIKSFHNQAVSGDILLYPDLHGIRGTDDIGILVNHEITKSGDWMTEYRLYDQNDDVGATTLERVDKLWKQMNGLPPYTKPKQKGFSIEGTIPDYAIVQMDETGGGRVIDDVMLDGVVIVPRPAYQDSIAHAVYKALGEYAPWQIRTGISNILRKELDAYETEDKYFHGRYVLDDVLHSKIDEIMTKSEYPDKGEALTIVFKEYGELMSDLIIKSQPVWGDRNNKTSLSVDLPINSKAKKHKVFKDLVIEVDKLYKSLIKESKS